MNRIVRYLCGRTKSPLGLEVLVVHEELHGYISSNKNIQDGPWKAIWGKKPIAQTAVNLMQTPLDGDSLDMVLKRERRLTVLQNLVRHSTLTLEQGKKLLSTGKVNHDIAKAWWQSGRVPAELKPLVSEMAGPLYEAMYKASIPSFSDQEVADTVGKTWSHGVEAEKLMEMRPSISSVFLRHDNVHLRITGAKSRFIFDQELFLAALESTPTCQMSGHRMSLVFQSLVTNPNVTPETIEAGYAVFREHAGYQTPTAGIWQAMRTRKEQFPYALKHPWEQAKTDKEFAILCFYANISMVRKRAIFELPWLSDTQRESVNPVRASKPYVSHLSDNDADWSREDILAFDFDARKLPIELVVDLMETELDMVGRQAWETAVTLLLDNYKGTVGDILNLARLL